MRPLDLHLGRPLTRGALTVFPIWNGLGRLGRGYLSLGGYFEAALVWQNRAFHAAAINRRHELVTTTCLDARQSDRAVGALIAAAAGDALGVPYELGMRALDGEPQMLGGGLGGIAPGLWSDDTELACAIALVSSTGVDLRTEGALDAIAAEFSRWYADEPPDVGVQTRAVLSQHPTSAEDMRTAARELHERGERTAGNGSLMRTSPVALAHLGDSQGIAQAARAVSELTHHDPVAGDACVLWCLAIDLAVRTGRVDVRVGLPHVDADYWAPLRDEAENVEPAHYAISNGWGDLRGQRHPRRVEPHAARLARPTGP